MGLFDNISKVKSSEGGVFFLPGNYLVRISKVKAAVSRKDVEFVAVEATILESDNPDRKPGSDVTQLYMGDKDAFLPNVKHFVKAATGESEDEIDAAGVEYIVSDENPLAGMVLQVQASMIKTRAQKDFTKVVWKPATTEQTKKYGSKAA